MTEWAVTVRVTMEAVLRLDWDEEVQGPATAEALKARAEQQVSEGDGPAWSRWEVWSGPDAEEEPWQWGDPCIPHYGPSVRAWCDAHGSSIGADGRCWRVKELEGRWG